LSGHYYYNEDDSIREILSHINRNTFSNVEDLKYNEEFILIKQSRITKYKQMVGYDQRIESKKHDESFQTK
jgi:hypothetical protein